MHVTEKYAEMYSKAYIISDTGMNKSPDSLHLHNLMNMSEQFSGLRTAGITGGFAGGERGVQQFVEEGDIKFRDEGGSSICNTGHPNTSCPKL